MISALGFDMAGNCYYHKHFLSHCCHIFFFTLSIYYGQEEPFMATLIGLYSNLSVVRSGDISLIHLSKFGCMFLSYLETKALM